MKTTALLILDQFVNAVEREVMTITPTSVQTQQNVSIVGKIFYQGPVNVKFGKKEKEMKLKVTKNLTYPETRKLYDQQQPEFTFAKVVQSLSAKPETKTASTQYNVEDSTFTESSKVIVAKNQKPSSQSTSSSTTSAQPQAGSQNRTNLSSNKPSSGHPNAKKTKQTYRVRTQN